jgi:hypothetical protein
MSESRNRNEKRLEAREAEGVVAKLPKESLKSLLYMVAGKPDSSIKLFRDPILVTPNDIIELNELIQEKLNNHSVEATITTVNITYVDDEIEQYGVWAEFVEHRWSTHKVTESLTVKWDFLVTLPSYGLPQRHTVVLKIASELTPLHFMQAMFSNDPDEVEKLEVDVAPVVCRIDFINHILSDELMRIVEGWHKSRIKPLQSTPYKYLDDNKSSIARIVHYSIPFFATLIVAGILHKYMLINYQGTAQITIGIMKEFMFWLLGSYLIIVFSNQTLGHWLGSRIYTAIDKYGEHAIFDFTNGDKNKQREVEQNNRNSIKQFVSSLIGTIAIDIISSVAVYFLFK